MYKIHFARGSSEPEPMVSIWTFFNMVGATTSFDNIRSRERYVLTRLQEERKEQKRMKTSAKNSLQRQFIARYDIFQKFWILCYRV